MAESEGQPSNDHAIDWHSLIKFMMSDRLQPGARASLRRMDVERPETSLPLYQILSHWQKGNLDRSVQKRFAAILKILAIATPHYAPNVSLGTALQKANIHESRVARLLASRDSSLRSQAIRIARQLASSGQPCNWETMCRLVRYEEKAESIRTRIAIDYYNTHESKQDKTQETVEE
jgi:CRISPR type I-E-associated protein CasB/Cse2